MVKGRCMKCKAEVEIKDGKEVVMKSIFSDKATVIIRAMLSEPKRQWTVRDFEKEFNPRSTDFIQHVAVK